MRRLLPVFAWLGAACNSVTRSQVSTAAASAAPAPASSAPGRAAAPSPSIPSSSPASESSSEPALPQEGGCTFEPWAPAGPEGESLFILAGDEASLGTYWVERKGRATHWLGWSPNAIFAWNGGVWRAESEHHEGKTEGCQIDPHAPEAPGTSTLEQLVLSRVDAPGRIQPLGPARLQSGGREVSAGSRLIGLLGPYLFIRSTTFVDGCGAHGNTTTSVSLIHLGTLRAPKLTLPPKLDSKAKAAVVSYKQESEHPGLPQFKWEATLPNFTGGKLGATFVFVTDTDYVSSDWGSYQHAVLIDGPPPPELAGLASVPALVTAFKCASPVLGFTQAPPGAFENDAIKRAFQPVPSATP